MRKYLSILLFTLLLAFFLMACNNERKSPVPEHVPDTTQEESPMQMESDMLKIEVLIGSQTFTASLYDNETARTFMKQLPMTLDMSELNGNEKYYYLENSLPSNADRSLSKICTGDIMLYGSNCIVLFYDSFSTSYSYTPIGHIDNPDGLVTAVGDGNVQVTFQ